MSVILSFVPRERSEQILYSDIPLFLQLLAFSLHVADHTVDEASLDAVIGADVLAPLDAVIGADVVAPIILRCEQVESDLDSLCQIVGHCSVPSQDCFAGPASVGQIVIPQVCATAVWAPAVPLFDQVFLLLFCLADSVVCATQTAKSAII